MPIESAADRAAFFHDDGELALFAEVSAPQGGDNLVVITVERNVIGLFDRAYAETGGDNPTEGYRPVFLVLDEDAQYLRHKHRLMLKGHVWEVTGVKSDGAGMTQLVLHKLGQYRYASEQPGYQYSYPFDYESGGSLAPDDPDHPRLRYPYTVDTYFEFSYRFKGL